MILKWLRKLSGSQAALRLLPWRLDERPEARPSLGSPACLLVTAPRPGGLGPELGEFWEAALGGGNKREET